MNKISTVDTHASIKLSAPGLRDSNEQAKRYQATAQRMGEFFTPNQVLGRLQTIGCVAVEITQKCNLDCTLCYLSEHSQSVADVPIEEIFRRLDQVSDHYGPGTHVQITGGDPTLRKHTELIEIVRYANQLGLYTALFTNGIAASRKLLIKLADAGLRDIAFHVDTTQRRKIDGREVEDEIELHGIREEYIERTKGLDLMVIFNTTVHKGNFKQLPSLVSFFRKHAKSVGLVSFQLQADTGRGEWRERDIIINQQTVHAQIEAGSTPDLPWDAVQVGHTSCHHYLPAVVINETLYPLVLDKGFFADFMRDFKHIPWDRQLSGKAVLSKFVLALMKQPRWWFRLLAYLGTQSKCMWRDLLKARGKIEKMTFFVQNFMDAQELVQERIDACSFMVMTAQGPVSMCQHNAKRDEYILKPIEITRSDGSLLDYQPLRKKKRDRALDAIRVEATSRVN